MSEKHLYIGGESPDAIKSKLGATAIESDGTFLDKTGSFTAPAGGTQKSLLDYIEDFDLTPPTNGVCFLCLDRDLSTGALTPVMSFAPTLQNNDNWILKRYDVANTATQSNEYGYSYTAYVNLENEDSLLTPYGYITKYSLEPKTSNKFTSYGFGDFASLLKAVIAENSCDELTELPLLFTAMANLITLVLPSEMNKITSMYNAFKSLTWLKNLTMPNSMSLCTNFSNSLQSTVIESANLPATVGAVTTMAFICFRNKRMKTFDFGGGSFAFLTTLSGAFQNCYLLDTILNFPTSLPELTTLQNAFQGTKITELTLPDSLPKVTTMSLMCSGAKDLITLTLPTAMALITNISSMCENALNLETISECTNWGTNQINADSVVTNAYKLTTFKQLAMRVSKIGIYGTSTKATAITSIDIDWANSLYAGSSPQIDISYNSLSDTEIDRIFTALPNVTGKTIVVKGNPGAATCTPTIATTKGWTVTTA